MDYEEYVDEMEGWVMAYGSPYDITFLPSPLDILDQFEEGISPQEAAMNWISHVLDCRD